MAGEKTGLWPTAAVRSPGELSLCSHCWRLLKQLLKASWISDGSSSTATRGELRSHSCPTCPADVFCSRVGGTEATGNNRLGYLYLGVCPSTVTDAYRGSVFKFCNRHEQRACTGLTCCLILWDTCPMRGKRKNTVTGNRGNSALTFWAINLGLDPRCDRPVCRALNLGVDPRCDRPVCRAINLGVDPRCDRPVCRAGRKASAYQVPALAPLSLAPRPNKLMAVCTLQKMLLDSMLTLALSPQARGTHRLYRSVPS